MGYQMSWLLAVLAVVIAVAAFLMRGQGPAAHAMFLRRTGLTFICVSTLFIGLFVAAETFADLGGWRAAALIALWLLPMAALSALAWYRPGWATVPLTLLTSGTIALAIWFAADPGAWSAFEDRTGPVRAVVSFAITLPLGLLGWRRPVTGGFLLLVLGLAPVTVAAIGSGFGAASLTAVSTPPVLTGVLYLVADIIRRQAASPGPVPTQATSPEARQSGSSSTAWTAGKRRHDQERERPQSGQREKPAGQPRRAAGRQGKQEYTSVGGGRPGRPAAFKHCRQAAIAGWAAARDYREQERQGAGEDLRHYAQGQDRDK